MAQTKNFVIFARAWSSSISKKPIYSTPVDANLMPNQMEIDELSTSSSSGAETPMSTTESTTSITSSSTDVTSENMSSIKDSQSRRSIDFTILENQFEETLSDCSESASPLWYILATAILLALHKEKLVGRLWKYLCRNQQTSEDELLSIARRIREACLKASTLVGFPRAINALLSLTTAIQHTHPHLSTTLSSEPSLRAPVSPSEKYTRGMSLFSAIYVKHTPRVLDAMTSTSAGDLTHFAINCIYGELLAEESIIGRLETGLLEFVCCLADGCGPQAKGHFFGSKNLGANDVMLRAVVELTEKMSSIVGVDCAWKAGIEDEDLDDEEGQGTGNDEWKFLDRVMS